MLYRGFCSIALLVGACDTIGARSVGTPTSAGLQADGQPGIEGRSLAGQGGLATGPVLGETPWIAETPPEDLAVLGAVAAGDIDGDGLSDVVVGAPFTGADAGDGGRVYVYRGTPDGPAKQATWTLSAAGLPDAAFASAVAADGDVNGDGFADLIVGAPGYSGDTPYGGRAFVFLGSAAGPATDPVWDVQQVDVPEAHFGQTVVHAGDVNVDGFGDVLVSSAPTQFNQYRRVYLFLGAEDGLAATYAWRTEQGMYDGYENSIAGAGDVNGDGATDVIMSTVLGEVHVYHGSQAGLPDLPSWQVDGYGRAVAGAGDVNGDGFADVLVSDAHYTNGEDMEGRAYVILGSPSGLADEPIWSGEADQMGALFGAAVSGAGDVDGDGLADIIVGVPSYDAGWTDQGLACVFLGAADGIEPGPAAWTSAGVEEYAGHGAMVGAAGDVNGDGAGDVFVLALWGDVRQAFVYFGVKGEEAASTSAGETGETGATGETGETGATGETGENSGDPAPTSGASATGGSDGSDGSGESGGSSDTGLSEDSSGCQCRGTGGGMPAYSLIVLLGWRRRPRKA